VAFEDPDRIAEMRESLDPVVAPEFEIVTVGPEFTGGGTTYRGLAGLSSSPPPAPRR
jgi:hypothetical protein